jgi:hypothetical protein
MNRITHTSERNNVQHNTGMNYGNCSRVKIQCEVGPCHNDMACPRPPNVEGSCECLIGREQPTSGGPPA